MRIRSLKPEFWRSEDIAALDWHTRLVFMGLWSYVDDNGVGRDDERIICADLFALDESFSESSLRAHAALNTLSARKLITRYSVNGRRFLHITTWEKHQKINRPSPPRLPLPTCGNAEIHDTLSEGSVRAHNSDGAGTGEQGNRGTGEEETPSTAARSSPRTPPGFDAFWDEYPRRVGKQDAIKAWGKAVKQADPADILAGAVQLAQDPNREDQFTPHAATWLNRGGWDDDPLPARGSPRRSTTDDRFADVLALKTDDREELDG